MKAFNLILALGAVMLIACGPVAAETLQFAFPPLESSALDRPAGIAAAIGGGFETMVRSVLAFTAMLLVFALVLWVLVSGPARRTGGYADGGFTDPGSCGVIRPLDRLPNEFVLKEPRKPPA